MDKLIIHTATRIILSVTSDDKPTIPDFCSVVDVPSGYAIKPNQKLDLDNMTQIDAEQADLDAFQDEVNPKRVKLRELNMLVDQIEADAALPSNIKDFVSKLRDFLN